MLGGSSGINFMVYVRGHPGDFDRWAEDGAAGWSYADVLPFFKKSEGLAQSSGIPIDAPAHSASGPLGVSVRSPLLKGAQEFVAAAAATGIKLGDYNGRDRGGPAGMASLVQITTRDGKRSSTYHAFLEGAAANRANLKIIAGATATRVVLEGARRALASDGRRVPARRRRSRDRDCGDRGDPERGSHRLAPSPDAVWRWAAKGARTGGRPMPSSFAPRRQAFEGSLADPSVLRRLCRRR